MQKVLYGVLASLVAVILIGFTLPRTHSIEVSREIDAHQATVFALVNDFRRFTLWAPWAETDPNARFIYSGPTRGEGATVTWDGAIVGRGTQTIVESRPIEFVGIVINPGETGEARTWFRLEPGTGTTIVHWGFEADHGMNIVGRYFASMLGSVVARDYEAGLANLEELAESLPAADFSDIEIEHLIVEPVQIAYLSTSARREPGAIADAMGRAYFEILSFIDDNNLDDAGASARSLAPTCCSTPPSRCAALLTRHRAMDRVCASAGPTAARSSASAMSVHTAISRIRTAR